jgi:hypothetical protein
MITTDIIAISIVLVCILLVISGTLKWVLRLMVGIVLGIVILICLGFLADNPRFNEMSKGFFQSGTIIPGVKNHIVSIADQAADQPLNPR